MSEPMVLKSLIPYWVALPLQNDHPVLTELNQSAGFQTTKWAALRS